MDHSYGAWGAATFWLFIAAAAASRGHCAVGYTPPMTERQRIFTMAFSKVYPALVNKAGRKGRTQAEVDEIICWLTGYTRAGLQKQIRLQTTFEEFFASAPAMNPKRSLIKGVVCGVRVEEVADPLMKKIRLLDKLVDELARGRPMEKILRS